MQDLADRAHRPLASDAELADLLAGFLARTLPKAAWTHRAHLNVGLALVAQHGVAAARTLMPEAIRRYNVASGGANTRTSGYHETLTQLYLTLIDRFLTDDPAGSLAERANRLFEAWGDRGVPGRYYSEGLLWSVEARKRWVLPDLKPV